jgi:hypothetical protein
MCENKDHYFGNKEKDFYSKQIGENEINKLSIWNTSQCQVDFQGRPSLKSSHVILTTENGQPVDNHTLNACSSRYNKEMEK